jgi:SPP1 gp7 family putative phage head morphogenesis protein
MWQDEHAYAFTVAKASGTDILQDIRSAVDEAIAGGTTFSDFQKRLKPTLQEKGWWGRKLMVDPKTGEEKEVQLGSTRRLNTIFDTNLRSSYAAGRWERINEVKKARPYLRYLAVLDERTRDKHRQWHDVILPVDDPFWQQYYPPNGWRCRCSVQQLSARDLKRLGKGITQGNPETPPKTYVNNRTGEVTKVPQGIDPGFAYNSGMARLRGLTPPPLDRPLSLPYSGPKASLPLPPPRSLPKTILWGEDLSDEAYAAKFLKEFGADIGKPAVFTDVAGEKILISEDLFKTSSGSWKISRDKKRFKYLGLLAQAIRDPDEIWYVWEEYPAGRWTLRRKYLARFDIEGERTPAFVLFDTNKDGWSGVTAFTPNKDDYIGKQRAGALVYRRTK